MAMALSVRGELLEHGEHGGDDVSDHQHDARQPALQQA